MDGFVGDIGSQTIDSDIDKRSIDCLNTDQVVDMHGLIRHTRGRLVRHVGAASQNTGSSNSQSSDTCALQELTTRDIRHNNQPHNLFCMPRSLFCGACFSYIIPSPVTICQVKFQQKNNTNRAETLLAATLLVLFEFFQKTSVPGNQSLVTMKTVPKGRTFNSSSSVL